MSTRMNTAETGKKFDTRMRVIKDDETSPYASRKMSRQQNPYTESYNTETKNRPQSNLSRSPSIGPLRVGISPKNDPKIISIPTEMMNTHKRRKSVNRRIRKQSMPYNPSSRGEMNRSNMTASKSKYVSRNSNYMSPLSKTKEYDTQK